MIMDSNAGESKVSKLFYSTGIHEHKNLTKIQQLGDIDVYLVLELMMVSYLLLLATIAMSSSLFPHMG
ncbi:hypothetical protein CYR69_01420 [Francisella tularensis subsp. holarctica]|nr:hypothetical protein CUZ57_03300 [Francisella tularensis subsp. holarctica]EBA52292.1 hypothetical protein FTHG_00610 [Francisella tularensis subsp. holarctica 257]PLQ24079.1 hypothetical protein CYR21_01210 [Francisella tularensis subsp. holarctica]PLQ26746.1 hypothetical protein CYR07_01690 [Francisella tularensis subsp. holarctica]PLQ38412.1 hypothetical protein CYR20_01685 [Francisella tularensis subsp. holarctica]